MSNDEASAFNTGKSTRLAIPTAAAADVEKQKGRFGTTMAVFIQPAIEPAMKKSSNTASTITCILMLRARVVHALRTSITSPTPPPLPYPTAVAAQAASCGRWAMPQASHIFDWISTLAAY